MKSFTVLLKFFELLIVVFKNFSNWQKQQKREQRRGEIEESPTDSNSELFGSSAGRVHIDKPNEKGIVRPDPSKD